MDAYVDTHCHLDIKTFDRDREKVIERAKKAGVIRILNPGIDIKSSEKSIGMAEKEPLIFAAVGVHPNSALSWKENSRKIIAQLAHHAKVVAIGEIGLDYYRDKAPKNIQHKVFCEQISLAAELGLPVIIHNRQATNDVLTILSEWHNELIKSKSPLAERPGVLHSFSETLEIAREAVKINLFIGCSGPVTFPNARELRQTMASLPLQQILLETDSPFLAPQPYRGTRNEPAYVRYVAEIIADTHDKLVETVAGITSNNAKRLFNW